MFKVECVVPVMDRSCIQGVSQDCLEKLDCQDRIVASIPVILHKTSSLENGQSERVSHTLRLS